MLRFAVPAMLAALTALPLCAQTATAADRIASASIVNSLDGPDIKPWHLKVKFQLFDDDGKPSQQGTAEEWWAAKDKWRLLVTQGSSVETFVRNTDGYFQTSNAILPTALEVMLQGIIHPVNEEDTAFAAPELREHKFGKVKADCVMMTQPIKGVSDVPLGLFPTYCTANGDVLIVSWLSASISRTAEKTGTFQGHHVPVKLGLMVNESHILEADVTALSMVPVTEVDLNTDQLAHHSSAPARVSSGIMAGSIINKVQPHYPQEARRNGISGSVVMHAIIGTDGRIHSLRVAQSPDGSLSLAALLAVEQWQYRPYLLQGVPASVDTTIMVNFNLNHF